MIKYTELTPGQAIDALLNDDENIEGKYYLEDKWTPLFLRELGIINAVGGSTVNEFGNWEFRRVEKEPEWVDCKASDILLAFERGENPKYRWYHKDFGEWKENQWPWSIVKCMVQLNWQILKEE